MVSHLSYYSTIVEGEKCVLTQVGVGRSSLNPLKRLADAGSWYATSEDTPIWDDRKPQQLDDDPHQTSKAIVEFRTWFDSFVYDPAKRPRPEPRVELRNEPPRQTRSLFVSPLG